jgi:hypothetical protein
MNIDGTEVSSITNVRTLIYFLGKDDVWLSQQTTPVSDAITIRNALVSIFNAIEHHPSETGPVSHMLEGIVNPQMQSGTYFIFLPCLLIHSAP